MRRCWWAIALAILTVPCVGVASDDSLRASLALQETFVEAIRRAEPSIACILVSRSDIYRRWFNQAPPADSPGRLGAFGPTELPRIGLQDQQERNEYLKLLEKRLTPRDRFQRGPRSQEPFLWKLFDLSDRDNVPESYGSGVVLNDQGLVLTNYHVVQGAAKVYVRLPGGQGSYADIHAADPRSDLAVLKLLDSRVRPPAVKIGDSGHARKGQLVLSLANPFAAGFRDGSPSASWGIISNIRRRTAATGLTERDRNRFQLHHMATLIQTDARLNLGCSGGALLNLQGELIGLTTALAAITGSETAGGFALPIDAEVRQIIGVLERGEEVSYGFLGVGFAPEYRRGEPPPLARVVQNSPAERAHLQPNDVILSVNDRPIREPDDLFLAIGICLAGSEARLEVRKADGATRTIKVTLDKYYVPDKGIASAKPPFIRGVRVDYTSVLCLREDSNRCPSGVYVSDVQPGSFADRARLHDAIVTHVNGAAVNSPRDFQRLAGKTAGPVELTLIDAGQPRTVRLD